MKTLILTALLLVLVLLHTRNYAQKPVKGIPSYVLQEMVKVFMDEVYDTSVKDPDRKQPLLNEKKGSYDFHYDKVYDYEPLGSLEIPKAILPGDMDGDGVAEMIITPFSNFGGSGSFAYVFLFKSVNGKWKLLTWFEKVDQFLKNQRISDGTLYGTIMEYDDDDAHCCPSLLTEIWYRYDTTKHQLVEGGRKFVKKTR